MSENIEPSEKVLTRVRKLLDMAEGFARMAERATVAADREHHEAERVAAMDRAMAMMSTYGIEQAMLASMGEVEDAVDMTSISTTGAYSYCKAFLVCRIAEALGCKPIMIKSGVHNSKKINSVEIVGYASARERVELLYTSLLIQGLSGAVRESDTDPWLTPRQRARQTTTLRSSYLQGFATEVGRRLMQAERYAARQNAAQNPEREAAGVSTALVLVDRAALVNQRYRELWPESATEKVRSRLVNDRAYGAGIEGGQRADIGTARFGSGRTTAVLDRP